jgi:LSU ribosomal protein L10P
MNNESSSSPVSSDAGDFFRPRIKNLTGGKKMAKIEEKKPIVEEISEYVKDAQSVVAVDYRGLTVAQDTELRKSLREAGVVYKVYKNTFLTRAFEGTDFAQLDEVLEGPPALQG